MSAIRLEGVTFSQPFFATGTQFLLPLERASQIDSNSDLAKLKIGVLKNTTTEKFVEEQYPSAEKVYFEGTNARAEAVKSLANNSIEAFVGDSILSTEEVERQGLAVDNYALLPKLPLTCDYYGMLLPDNDPQWQQTINNFLNSQAGKRVSNRWLAGFSEETLSAVNVCNRNR